MRRMRGIVRWGVHIPYRRLDLTSIREVTGQGGASGTRSVAGYDEDTTTMAVEAGRRALDGYDGASLSSLWFATAEPAYMEKANAPAIHAALRLDREAAAYDVVGSMRSAVAALRAALGGTGPALVAAAGLRTGLPGSTDEAHGGDGAVALLVAEQDVCAEPIGWGSATEDLLDRWRTPGDVRTKAWEERFAEVRYADLAVDAWNAAGIEPGAIDRAVVCGVHARAASVATRKLGLEAKVVADLSGRIGNTGAAHPFLVLAAALEQAAPGETIALVVLADGAEVAILRMTAAVDGLPARRAVEAHAASGAPLSYGKFLTWRGLLAVEPPRRPEPARVSASAAARNADWKYGFIASVDDEGGVHLPPTPTDTASRPMAGAEGTVVTFTVDRLAYSPSPPIVFAVVDFDGGGRLPIELTDVDEEDLQIGMRVEMTFRRLFTADGIHNYFWKARPAR